MAVPAYVQGDDGTGQRRLGVNAARLWTGGLATAVVAALLATGLMHLLLLSCVGLDGTSGGQ
jgi:hypothetical protein